MELKSYQKKVIADLPLSGTAERNPQLFGGVSQLLDGGICPGIGTLPRCNTRRS